MHNTEQKKYLLEIQSFHLEVIGVCLRLYQKTNKEIFLKYFKEIAQDIKKIKKELVVL